MDRGLELQLINKFAEVARLGVSRVIYWKEADTPAVDVFRAVEVSYSAKGPFSRLGAARDIANWDAKAVAATIKVVLERDNPTMPYSNGSPAEAREAGQQFGQALYEIVNNPTDPPAHAVNFLAMEFAKMRGYEGLSDGGAFMAGFTSSFRPQKYTEITSSASALEHPTSRY